MAPRRPAPRANRKPGESAEAQRARQQHQDQRTAFRQVMRENGINKINAEARDAVLSRYGVRANGQTLQELRRQSEAKDREIASDAAHARQQRTTDARARQQAANATKRGGVSRGNPSAKTPKGYGAGKGASAPAGAGAGGPVDRSDAIKRAWATRKKMYGSSGKKAS